MQSNTKTSNTGSNQLHIPLKTMQLITQSTIKNLQSSISCQPHGYFDPLFLSYNY